ncbi:MAG: M56 family metallopeptidase [Gammaproteobacteria bacterium]|nr:M56 family metallopeptidase [Gammaproteobacteria bacterium]
MEKIVLLDSLIAVLGSQSSLHFGVDLLLKSSIVIGLTYVVATIFRHRLSNSSSHLLWINSMLCVAFLPLAMLVLSLFPAVFLDSGPITVISIQASSTGAVGLADRGWGSLLGIGYTLVASLLLLRLLFSGVALNRINAQAVFCTEKSILLALRRSCEFLEISRTVQVKFSEDIASPMSFGLFKPVVILPAVANDWAETTLADVMVHELSHIKRLDWPTMLFCHVLTSLLWINPLLWFASSRVDEDAEKACDAAVLRCGQDGVRYAEDLLRLARESLENKQAPLLAQLMFDESNLTMRIRNILSGKLIGKTSKVFVVGLTFSTFLVVSACSGVNLFGSSLQDQDILPTVAEPPQYPTRAANEGIEGWTLLSFTVTADGLVEENSVEVLDAEPVEIFDRASIRAAQKFEFQPRIRNGRAVDIPGVKYVFKYELEPGGNRDTEQRPPPSVRSRQ